MAKKKKGGDQGKRLTAMSHKLLQSRGWVTAPGSYWVSHNFKGADHGFSGGYRKDTFGCIDIWALRAEERRQDLRRRADRVYQGPWVDADQDRTQEERRRRHHG